MLRIPLVGQTPCIHAFILQLQSIHLMKLNGGKINVDVCVKLLIGDCWCWILQSWTILSFFGESLAQSFCIGYGGGVRHPHKYFDNYWRPWHTQILPKCVAWWDFTTRQCRDILFKSCLKLMVLHLLWWDNYYHWYESLMNSLCPSNCPIHH